MVDHWREKDHWFYNFEKGQTQGWPLKKELWDVHDSLSTLGLLTRM